MSSEIYAREIQIRKLMDNQYVLMLICENQDIAISLADMIDYTNGNYQLKCYTNDNNKFSLGLLLSLPEYIVELRIETSKNRKNYLPIDWLMANKVKFISAAWENHKLELFHTPLKPLPDLVFLPLKKG